MRRHDDDDDARARHTLASLMGARRRRAHRTLAGLDVGRPADEEYGGGDAAYAKAPSSRLADARTRGKATTKPAAPQDFLSAFSSQEIVIATCASVIVVVIVLFRLV